MPLSTKLDDKLEGVSNFRAWKYKISLILEENKMLRFIQNEQPKPEAAKAKEEIEEYVLYSALSGAVTPGSDTWLINNGVSNHMTGKKDILHKQKRTLL